MSKNRDENCLEELEILEAEFEKRIGEMKDKYNDIPVPKEAMNRILEGIKEAKNDGKSSEKIVSFSEKTGRKNLKNEEKNMEKNQKNKNKLFKKTVAAAAAVVVTVGTLANVSPITANAMEKLPIIGTLAKIMTFRTFEDQQGNIVGKVEIPKIEEENGTEIAANKDLEEYANSLISAYEEEIRETNGEGKYELKSTYDVVFENEKYVSIRINTSVIMASGAEYIKVFTIDKNTGKTVPLKEILHGNQELLNGISQNIIQQMQEQMASDENVIYFLEKDLPDSNFEGISGDESYYFNENGELVICFDEYEVAPGYMGAVTFTIPKSVTGELK